MVTNIPPNWWQLGQDLRMDGVNTTMLACINILSQEVASTTIRHRNLNKDGSADILRNSKVSRVLRKPNSYQTRSDFWLMMMGQLLSTGNAFAVIERKQSGLAIEAFHPVPTGHIQPLVSGTEVFYQVSKQDNALFDPTKTYLSDDILHIRINCNKHPVMGESPVQSFVYAMETANAIQQQTSEFFQNSSKPSGVLKTPKQLTPEQVKQLKDSWQRASSGLQTGGTPVLTNEVSFDPLTMSAVDAELIATHKMASEQIAQIYRVPPFMLGHLEHSSFNNADAMNRIFYSSCLRFYLEHIEDALDLAFDLPSDQDVEFDIEASMHRTEIKERFDAYGKAIQGAVITPNEARKREGLPPVEGGDSLYLQKQMVPVDHIAEILSSELKPDPEPQPDPKPPEPPEPDTKSIEAELQRLIA